jgi:hypothetical protein
VTSFTNSTYPAQNENFSFNNNIWINCGILKCQVEEIN